MALDSASNNKRIAKNTILLYFRMFVMMAVGLFTSRVILDALGASDYGIYNVVGGLVTMFSVLTGAMSVATSRFLTFALGVGDREQLRKTFVTAVNIHLLIAVAMIVIAEVVGIWFLNNKLNIPAERMGAANIVLQLIICITMNRSYPLRMCYISMLAYYISGLSQKICRVKMPNTILKQLLPILH